MNSQHLQDMVDGEVIPEWMALKLDRLSKEDMKTKAADELKGTLEEAVDQLCERTENPQGKMVYQSAHVLTTGTPAPPVSKHAHAVLNKLERYISWDLVYVVEGWVGDNVPPYRWVRRGFSLAVSYFSIQKVFVFLVSIALLYGCFRLVSISAGWVWKHTRYGSMTNAVHVTSNSASLVVANALTIAGVAIPQITSAQIVAGNKLMLHWNPAGDGYTYQVFRNCYPDNPVYKPRAVADNTVSGSGALVDIQYDIDCINPSVYLMGFSPAGVPSELSDPVIFHLSLVNDRDSVEPIAITPTVAPPSTAVTAPPKKVSSAAHPQQHNVVVAAEHGQAQIQNISINQHEINKTQTPPAKSSFLSAFAKNLLNNADGVVASAIPIAPVSQGVIAVKNAAMKAHDVATQDSNTVDTQ